MVDEVEGYLASDLEAITPTEAEPCSHLDDESRVVSIEVDRALGEPDPLRPEPSHIAPEGDGGDDGE